MIFKTEVQILFSEPNRIYHLRYDQLHRKHGPSVIYQNGTLLWHLYDKKHRDDGPAYMYKNGEELWFKNNVYVDV
jgi:hypothetical protein